MGFAVRERFAEVLHVVLIIQNGLKTSQTILSEHEKHIAISEIEMRTAVALPDVAPGRVAQKP